MVWKTLDNNHKKIQRATILLKDVSRDISYFTKKLRVFVENSNMAHWKECVIVFFQACTGFWTKERLTYVLGDLCYK